MKEIKSLYIHYPFCRHLCNYCDFYKHKLSDEQQIKDFEALLQKQIQTHSALIKEKGFSLNNLETLYIGGGTPSLWSKSGSRFLNTHLLPKINFENNHEFTLEVDPGTWTDDELKQWKKIGVNRFSVGVQSYDEDFIKLLDREHTMAEANETLSYFKKNKDNFSVDLMLGLPHGIKKRNIKNEIDQLVEFSPNHFSVYILKCRKNYPHYDSLPSDDEAAEEYLLACDYLNSLGFKQYEVSNFAQDGFQSKHNLRYWQYDTVAAIGPNASGLLVLSDTEAFRYQWKSSSPSFVSENLAHTSLSIEKFYMQMRAKNCLNLDWLTLENKKLFNNLKEKWTKLGYVAPCSEGFELTSRGYLLLDSLMNDIFNTLSV